MTFIVKQTSDGVFGNWQALTRMRVELHNKISDIKHREMRTWAQNHCQASVGVFMDPAWMFPDLEGFETYEWGFEREDDALLFKLRWGDCLLTNNGTGR